LLPSRTAPGWSDSFFSKNKKSGNRL
jgi:hypothetical protein